MIRELKVMDAHGRLIDSVLEVDEVSEPATLRLIFDKYDSGIISDDYIFFCLKKLHAILDKQNLKLLCNGCRYDVWPSGMSLDMGGGIKAYQLTMGQRARIADLVDIFDPTNEIDKLKTVKVQETFYEEWLKR